MKKFSYFLILSLLTLNINTYSSDNNNSDDACLDSLSCSLEAFGSAITGVGLLIGGIAVYQSLNPINKYLEDAANEILPHDVYDRLGVKMNNKIKYVDKYGSDELKENFRNKFIDILAKEENLNADQLNNFIDSQPSSGSSFKTTSDTMYQIKSASQQLQNAVKQTGTSGKDLFELTEELPEGSYSNMSEAISLVHKTLLQMKADGDFTVKGRIYKNGEDVTTDEFKAKFRTTANNLVEKETNQGNGLNIDDSSTATDNTSISSIENQNVGTSSNGNLTSSLSESSQVGTTSTALNSSEQEDQNSDSSKTSNDNDDDNSSTSDEDGIIE